MSDKNHDQFIDNLLDASLARYSGVTPRAGLAGRILANPRARVEPERRGWLVWAWGLAAGAIAAAIVVGVLNLAERRARPAPPTSVAMRNTGPPGISPSPRVTKRSGQMLTPRRAQVQRASRVRVEREADEPRLAVFPSPRPLTKQEELLIHYARVTPASALSAFPSETEEMAALEFKALEITPLDSEVSETKNNQ